MGSVLHRGKIQGRLALVLAMALGLVLMLFEVGSVAAADTDHASDSGVPSEAPVLTTAQRKNLISVKLYCLLIIFTATMMAGISPYFMRWNQSFLVLGIQFAGGVFMTTALLHFLGDANSTFEKLSDVKYPFAFMLCVCGYVLTMIGDQTVHHVHEKTDARATEKLSRLESSSLSKSSKLNPDNDEQGKPVRFEAEPADAYCKADCKCSDLEAGAKKAAPIGQPGAKPTFADAILLILALCFHSVFEGLAIGVAAKPYDAWRNLWTVMLHKAVAAISMSIALLRLIPDRPFISVATYAFGFAASSPIGIAIGIIIDSLALHSATDWTYAITMGIASGVFMFVAINHLFNKGYVPTEKLTVDTPLFKLSAIIGGCGLIFSAMYYE